MADRNHIEKISPPIGAIVLIKVQRGDEPKLSAYRQYPDGTWSGPKCIKFIKHISLEIS